MPHDVTEADRRAQAALYTNIGKPGMAEEILAGEMDDHPGVQAFAAHRIAAVAEERARVVDWLLSLGTRPLNKELAQAIENGVHVGEG